MKETSFEDNMNELEKVVQELESGNLDLESAIKKFEQGMEISKQCSDYLEKAEKRISVLIKEDENNAIEEEFK